ncbi:hypothetical protein BASA61_004321 [Batrachochytrium salamandrivorans]|nr:hypothetical protein BASA61_004321 [Batrachochytrium salamandrivorans]
MGANRLHDAASSKGMFAGLHTGPRPMAAKAFHAWISHTRTAVCNRVLNLLKRLQDRAICTAHRPGRCNARQTARIL